ncbi:MAG: group II intron maturase-specific domain-containing protein [Mycobacterium sp.]
MVRAPDHRNAHRTLADLLRRLNPAIRGWCTYFQQVTPLRRHAWERTHPNG